MPAPGPCTVRPQRCPGWFVLRLRLVGRDGAPALKAPATSCSAPDDAPSVVFGLSVASVSGKVLERLARDVEHPLEPALRLGQPAADQAGVADDRGPVAQDGGRLGQQRRRGAQRARDRPRAS